MKSIAKDQDIEEGELPDEDSPPVDPFSGPVKIAQNFQLKEKQTSDRSLRKQEESDESSAQIIFQTVPEKSYRDNEFSPQKKKKKIQKVQVKAKAKDKSNDRSSYDRQKKIEKRVNPIQSINQNQGTRNPSQEKEDAPTFAREYQQNSHFPNSYMYMNPMGQFIPQMYPSPNGQFSMPYMHLPPQFPMSAPMPNMPPIGHMPYQIMPQQMYQMGMPIKQYQSKQPDRAEKYKYEGMKAGSMQEYAAQMAHNNPNNQYPPANPVLNTFRPQEKFVSPPNPYQLNHYMNPPYSAAFKSPPQPERYLQRHQRQQRVEKPERPKEKPAQAPQQYQQQFQPPKDKRKQFIEGIRREVKRSLKDLEIGEQQQILQTLRCILKYSSQASQTLFPPQTALFSQIESNYQKNLSKLSRLIGESSQKSELINRVLLGLQMKDLVLRLRERNLFNRLITAEELQLARRMRGQLDSLAQR